MQQPDRKRSLEKYLAIGGGAFLLIAVSIWIGYSLRGEIRFLERQVEIAVDELQRDPMTVLFKNEDSAPLDIPAGFEKFQDVEDPGYLLLAGYLADEKRTAIQLLDLKTGAPVKRWDPDPEAIRAYSDYHDFKAVRRFTSKSPLVLEDGGIVFIDNPGPLVRLNACGEIQWVAKGMFHHSLERDLDGNFIVPIRNPKQIDTPITPIRFDDDAVATVSPEGKILEIRSVAEMLIDNGYTALFYSNYPTTDDPIHLNDVEVAQADTANWRRGDWLISIRILSTVFVYRPSTRKIVWLKTGPWLKQHDPDYADDGTISVFSNDTIGRSNLYTWGYGRVLVVDPGTDAVTSLFEDQMKAHKIRTRTQGLHRVLSNGDVFVEQTDVGRLVRVGPNGLVWSYYNKGESGIGVLHWSRFLNEQEFAAIDLSKTCG